VDCKRIQELLMTDYIDGELKPPRKEDIEVHLKVCRECREFKLGVEKAAVKPFRDSGLINPPDYLWHRIKDSLAAEPPKKSALAAIIDRLKVKSYPLRPALIYATLAVLIAVVFGLNLLRGPAGGQKIASAYRPVNDYLEENMEFLAFLDGNGNGESVYTDTGLGTYIEEYFL